MNESDIEFTVGLDLSDAEKKLNQFQGEMKMADAVFNRVTSQPLANRSFEAIRNSQGYKGFPFEKFNSYDNPILNSAKKFESVVSLASEKLRMQAERMAARREYNAAYKANDIAGMQTATEKFATANQNLKNIADIEKANKAEERKQKQTESQVQTEEEITDESKAQNREFAEQIIKLGKILAIVALIKKAIGEIKKAWEKAFDIHQETLQNIGFLSKDPEGAFRANSDKTREIMYAGIANWGKAAPFSRSAYDEFAAKIQNARENAMKGYGVDEHLTIATQYLYDRYGTKLNAVQLLTGDPTRTNTEITNEILNAVEKALPNIARLPEGERNRTLGYIKDLIGPEMMDRLMANINLNLRSGSTETSVEKILSRGGSIITAVNYAKAGKEFTDSASAMTESFKSLHYVLLGRFSPALQKLADMLSRFANWLADKFHIGDMDKQKLWDITSGKESSATLDMLDIGVSANNRGTVNKRLYDIFNKTTKYGAYYDYADIKDDAKYIDMVKNYKNVAAQTFANPKATAAETFQALVYQHPKYASGNMGATLENWKIHTVLEALFNMQNEFGESLSADRFAEMYGGGIDEFYQFGGLGALFATELQGKKFGKLEDFIKFAEKNKKISSALTTLFSEGGAWDVTPYDVSKNAYGFLTGGIPAPLLSAFKSAMWTSLNLGNTGGMFEVGGDVTVHVTDVYGREVQTETVPLKQKRTMGGYSSLPQSYRNAITLEELQ